MLSRDTRRYSGSRRSSNLFGALTFLAVCMQIVAFVGGGSVVVEQLSGPVTETVNGTVGRGGAGVGATLPRPEVHIIEDLAGDGLIGAVDPVVATVPVDLQGQWQADLVVGRSYLAVVSADSLPAGAVARPPITIEPGMAAVTERVAGPSWFLGVEGPGIRVEMPTPPSDLRAGESVEISPAVHNDGQLPLVDVVLVLATGAEVCRIAEVPIGGVAPCSVRLAVPLGGSFLDVVARATSEAGPVESSGRVLLVGSGFPAVDVGVTIRGQGDDFASLATGSALDRTVDVRNTGDLRLGPVQVQDDQAGVVCVLDRLEPGQGRSCRVVRDAEPGSHTVEVWAEAGVLDESGSALRERSGSVVAPVADSASFGYEGIGEGIAQVERPANEGPALSLELASGDTRARGGATPEVLVGTEIDLSYEVRNTGDTPLANVVVTDDDEGLVCTIPTLPVGATQACTLPVAIGEPGSLTATATASATAVDGFGVPLIDAGAGLPEARVVARDFTSVRGVEPALVTSVEIVAAPQGPDPIAAMSRPVEVSIDNVGDSMVVDLVATTTTDAGTRSLVCDSEAVGPGQTLACHGDVEVPPGSSEVRLDLSGVVQTAGGARLGRIEASDSVEARVPVAVLAARPQVLGARADGAVMVSVMVENEGPDPATDLALTLGSADDLIVGVAGNGWRCGGPGCVLGRLDPGAASSLVVALQPESSVLEIAPAVDSAVIDAGSEALSLTIDVDRARVRAGRPPSWAPWLGSTRLTLAGYAAMFAGFLVWWRLAVSRRLAASF